MANQSFWTTTSGMATGIAGTLTGVVAIAGIAAQAGWIGGANDSDDARTTAAGDTSTTTSSLDETTSTTVDDGDDDRTDTSAGTSRDDDGSATTATTSRTSAAGSPTYTVDPTAAAFDALGAKTRTLTVRNTGSVELVVQDIDVEGDGAGRFAVSGSGCTSAPVDPGRSCDLEVNFTPPSSGEVEATLVIDVEDARAREVALTGKAIL